MANATTKRLPDVRNCQEIEKSEVQGIIGSGFAHLDRMAYLFLQITDAAATRAWLGDFVDQITTSANWEKDENGEKIKPDPTYNLAFTHSGFAKLGVPDDAMQTFSREFIEGMSVHHQAKKFDEQGKPIEGETKTVFYRAEDILGDEGLSSPEHWAIGGIEPENEIDLLLIMYASDDATRADAIDAFEAGIEDAGLRIIFHEDGYRDGIGREHFGFRDGVSNPTIEGIHTPPTSENDRNYDNFISAGEFILGYRNQYGQYPATPITKSDPQDMLAPLPGSPGGDLQGFKDFGRNGTYLVYRKLEQRVAAFWNFMQRYIEATDGATEKAEIRKLASKFVGRWPSGAPITLTPDEDNPDLWQDRNFRYMGKKDDPNDGDKHGYGCPFSSHMRRANPRDSFIEDYRDIGAELSIDNSKQHRIMRRGSSFGAPLVTDDLIEGDNVPLDLEDDGVERGLHFLCVNADLHRQFEFIQQVWCNNPKFNHLYNDMDPIMGPHEAVLKGDAYVKHEKSDYVTIEEAPLRERVMNFQRFVETLGGLYLFLPSIQAMRYVAALDS